MAPRRFWTPSSVRFADPSQKINRDEVELINCSVRLMEAVFAWSERDRSWIDSPPRRTPPNGPCRNHPVERKRRPDSLSRPRPTLEGGVPPRPVRNGARPRPSSMTTKRQEATPCSPSARRRKVAGPCLKSTKGSFVSRETVGGRVSTLIRALSEVKEAASFATGGHHGFIGPILGRRPTSHRGPSRPIDEGGAPRASCDDHGFSIEPTGLTEISQRVIRGPASGDTRRVTRFLALRFPGEIGLRDGLSRRRWAPPRCSRGYAASSWTAI
jgi:hypothetical protein